MDYTTGQPCPAGNYCPQGIAAPKPCPLGSYSSSSGLRAKGECQPCPGGFYCNGTGLTAPSGECEPRYYCESNATTATPEDGGLTGDPCIVGHYCPGNTADPIPCDFGTFMNITHASQCWPCTPGYYCTNGHSPQACPSGYYCPEGTGLVWQPCPRGTYSSDTMLSNETQCLPCTIGSYCGSYNLTTPEGPCDAGYYCLEGSDTATPDTGYTGTAGPCPEGHYCPANTGVPLPCPRGTFSNQTHLTISSECTDCNYGTYCAEEGLIEPTAPCWGGFYCLRGAKHPNNPVEDSTGGPCPAGHYCTNGTSYPLGCDPGTYNPATGQETCLPCPASYYCPGNNTDYLNNECPAGHYCPEGTAGPYDFPCEMGFYNNHTTKSQESDCLPCAPGMYCDAPGMAEPRALCAPGWFCTRGAWTNKPAEFGNTTADASCYCESNTTGGLCQPGEFCPEGSVEPVPCTGGKHLDTDSSQHETLNQCFLMLGHHQRQWANSRPTLVQCLMFSEHLP